MQYPDDDDYDDDDDSISPKSELDSFGRKDRQEDQMRMKRFSSALCLADKQRQQQQQQQQVDKQQAVKLTCQECGQKLADNRQRQQHECRQRSREEENLSAQELKKLKKKQQKQLVGQTNKSKGKNKNVKPPQPPTPPEVPKLIEPPKDEKQSAKLGISTVDPMILARQRRPSVCNQASVNVDQQGK